MVKKMTVVQFQTELEKMGVLPSKIDEIVAVIVGDKSDTAKDELFGNFYDIATATTNDPESLNHIKITEIRGIVETSKKEIDIRNSNNDFQKNQEMIDSEEQRLAEEQRKKEEEFKARMANIDFSKPLSNSDFDDIANNYDLFLETASTEQQIAVIDEMLDDFTDFSVRASALSKLAKACAVLREIDSNIEMVSLDNLPEGYELEEDEKAEIIKLFQERDQNVQSNEASDKTPSIDASNNIRVDRVQEISRQIIQMESKIRDVMSDILEEKSQEGSLSEVSLEDIYAVASERLPQDFDVICNRLGMSRQLVLNIQTKDSIEGMPSDRRNELQGIYETLQSRIKREEIGAKITGSNIYAEEAFNFWSDSVEKDVVAHPEKPDDIEPELPKGWADLMHEEDITYDEMESFFDYTFEAIPNPWDARNMQTEIEGQESEQVIEAVQGTTNNHDFLSQSNVFLQQEKYETPQFEVPDEEVDRANNSKNPFVRFAAKIKNIFSKNSNNLLEDNGPAKLLGDAQNQIEEGIAKTKKGFGHS